MAQWYFGWRTTGADHQVLTQHQQRLAKSPWLTPISVDNFVENPLCNGLQAMPDAVCDALMTF
jgi:hypothetical protein